MGVLVCTFLYGVYTIFSDDFAYFIDRFESAIYIFGSLSTGDMLILGNASGDISNAARLMSVFMVLSSTLDRPILGLGPSLQYSLSAFPTMFSNLGILGIYFWSQILFYRNRIYRYNKYIFFVTFGIFGMFLGTPNTACEVWVILLNEATRLLKVTEIRENEIFVYNGRTSK